MTECTIKQESYDESNRLDRAIKSVGTNYLLGESLPKTKGMHTLEQAQYFIPKTSDAYYGALFDSTVPNIYNAGTIAKGILVGSSIAQMNDPWLDVSSYMIDDTIERRRMGG